MKRKLLFAIIAAVILITAVLVFVHLKNDPVDPENAVTIACGSKSVKVSLSDLDADDFSGTLINGKGDKTSSVFRGIALNDLLAQKGFEIDSLQILSIEALSQDQYSAVFSINEIENIYIAVSRDGEAIAGLSSNTNGAQLIIFGDPDSRRCVRYLESITLNADE